MAQWLRPDQIEPNPQRYGHTREVREKLRALQGVVVTKNGEMPAAPPVDVRAIAKKRLGELKVLRERNRALAATNNDSVAAKFAEWRDRTLEELKGAGEQLKLRLSGIHGDATDPTCVQRAIHTCEQYLFGLAHPWLGGLGLVDLFVPGE